MPYAAWGMNNGISSPYSLEYNAANKCMYMNDEYTGNLYVVNASNKLVATSMQGFVGGMSFNPLNGYMYILNSCTGSISGGYVTVLNSSTSSTVGWLKISKYHAGAYGDAFASVYDPANELMYVTSSESGTISIIQINGPLTVNFTERGLKPGTEWAVTLNGITESSQNRVIQFSTLPGNSSFDIKAVKGYFDGHFNSYFTDIPMQRNLTLSATTTNIGVSFTSYSFMNLLIGGAIVATIAISIPIAYTAIKRGDKKPP